MVQAFDVMTAMEKPLMDRIVSYLTSPEATAKGYRMIRCVEGPRVPTITFVHKTASSASIVAQLHARGIYVRNGYMYSMRLVRAFLGRDVYPDATLAGLLAAQVAVPTGAPPAAASASAETTADAATAPAAAGYASGTVGDDAAATPDASTVGPVHNESDGVVRVSLLHYNTMEEVERFLTALNEIAEAI